jgi:hypothetical protein
MFERPIVADNKVVEDIYSTIGELRRFLNKYTFGCEDIKELKAYLVCVSDHLITTPPTQEERMLKLEEAVRRLTAKHSIDNKENV